MQKEFADESLFDHLPIDKLRLLKCEHQLITDNQLIHHLLIKCYPINPSAMAIVFKRPASNLPAHSLPNTTTTNNSQFPNASNLQKNEVVPHPRPRGHQRPRQVRLQGEHRQGRRPSLS
jgi:hypothetical protein